jgi:hypothetical protein
MGGEDQPSISLDTEAFLTSTGMRYKSTIGRFNETARQSRSFADDGTLGVQCSSGAEFM